MYIFITFRPDKLDLPDLMEQKLKALIVDDEESARKLQVKVPLQVKV